MCGFSLHSINWGAGWEVQLQKVEEDRFNLFAHRPGVAKPKLIFNSHLDTVPPFIPSSVDSEEEAQVEGGRRYLRGRGACDTKGLIAAQLIAAQQLLSIGLNGYFISTTIFNKSASLLSHHTHTLFIPQMLVCCMWLGKRQTM